MTWQPSGLQILVRPCLVADRTRSGIIVPDEHREAPQTGLVVAVGPGVHAELTGALVSPTHAAGELVLYGKYAGSHVDTDHRALLLLDTEVLAFKPSGTFRLVEHVLAGPAPVTVFHEDDVRCEHCDPEPPSAYLAAERARSQSRA